jgi:hypothetical protein
MDEWVDGWMDGYKDGCVDGWKQRKMKNWCYIRNN